MALVDEEMKSHLIPAAALVSVNNDISSGAKTVASLWGQTSKLKIFVDKRLCSSVETGSLSPVLAFHWQGLSSVEIADGKFNPRSPFVSVENLNDSDVCVLPGVWNHYFWHNRMKDAVELANEARRHGKQILIWFNGDLPPVVPLDNALVFQCAMDRSRREKNRHAAPYFIDDPLTRYPEGKLDLRKKEPKPLVGFCGYAAARPAKTVYGVVRNAKHNLACLAGRSNYRSTTLIPATVLRARVLRRLASDSRIACRFIVRDRYRAGHRRGSDQSEGAGTTARQFFDNILNTDYTVCVRGNGNWSVRFYETLASGRIPIFVDTDCVLPVEFALDWKRYCVWVDRSDVSRIGRIVSDFHSQLSADEFVELQLRCRKLWEERLSLGGFMNHLFEYFQCAAQ